MGQLVKGFVLRAESKNGTSKNGRAYTLYSALIENVDGSEFGWVGFGFDGLPFNEGDYVEFEVEEKNGRKQFIKGTGSKPKNPPARKVKEVETKAEGKVSSVDGYNRQTNPIDAARMTYANSRDAAIAVVELLLANKALPLSKTDTKAGEAKRFEEITAAIDKLTVQYTKDGLTQRLFDVVADAGEGRVSTKPDGDIPDAAKPVQRKEKAGADNASDTAADEGDSGDSDDDDTEPKF